MTDTNATPAPDLGPGHTPGNEENVRWAALEGRVQALEGQLDELLAMERGKKQRAVYYRLILLVLLLMGFFFLRMKQGAAP